MAPFTDLTTRMNGLLYPWAIGCVNIGCTITTMRSPGKAGRSPKRADRGLPWKPST